MAISTDDITTLIQSRFPDAEVMVLGADGKFQITVIDESFAGLNAVKRQQSIYRIINEHIGSGDIHAVNMLLHTHEEHAPQS